MKCLCLLTLLLTSMAQAATLQQLLEEDKLRQRSWLTPENNIVPGQEVQLTIEISTRRWFAGGTRIKLPEVPGLVVLQRDLFATNLSRRDEGVTWVVQRWHLELYPQKEGSYVLPPITLGLAVNDARDGIVQGQLQTSALRFEAKTPPLLQANTSWVASPEFSVTQTLDRDPAGLRPGDAFRRDVVFTAENLTSMMLPSLDTVSPEGLSAYPETPELSDQSNRGDATAVRREQIVYVVERAGQYQLPEQAFYWWNTDTGEMDVVLLPAIDVDAGSGVSRPGTIASTPPETAPTPADPRWLLLLLLPGIAYLLFRLRRARKGEYREKQLLKRVERELLAGREAQGLQLLYQWLNLSRPAPDWYRLRQAAETRGNGEMARRVSELIESVYAAGENASAQQLAASKLVRREGLVRLLKQRLLAPARLTLNPGDPDPDNS